MKEFLDKLQTYEPLINPTQMPKIDLYMDQVIQLFENQYEPFLRTKDEKVLTKTMINNYSKEKLYEPIKKKKYDLNHLMLLSMIYQLKNTLTIADIKKITRYLSAENQENELFLEGFYEQLYTMDEFIYSLVKENINVLDEKLNTSHLLDEQTKKIFYINVLSQMSTYYKHLAEKLVDDIQEIEDIKDSKTKNK